jgi:hypothetical protein
MIGSSKRLRVELNGTVFVVGHTVLDSVVGKVSSHPSYIMTSPVRLHIGANERRMLQAFLKDKLIRHFPFY